MKVTLIAAMSEGRVIGRDGAVPWRLPEDMRRFKQRTLGHPIIMGRRTFESLEKELAGRTCIVLTRRGDYSPPGALVAASLEHALRLAREAPGGREEVFVGGGEGVYREALRIADAIELTVVHAAIRGDTFFPQIDECQWILVGDERHEADGRHAHAFSFRRYVRRPHPASLPRTASTRARRARGAQ
jgi:dihydrofolate reductase